MSQLIWMINLIPDVFWTLLLWAGVLSVIASYLLGKIPFVKQYKIPLRVGGVVAVLIGVYFYGVIANEEKWQAKIRELEEQVKVAEAKSSDTNTVIKTEVVEKVKVVKERAKTQIEYVDRVIEKDKEVIKYIENCPVPKSIIDQINEAAKGVKQ
jgi:hypothetical protein